MNRNTPFNCAISGNIADLPSTYIYSNCNHAMITGNIADLPVRTLEAMRKMRERHARADKLGLLVER